MNNNILQAFIDKVYRYPRDKFRYVRRFGGHYRYHKMMKANEAMQAAALKLPPVQSYPEGYPVFFLTGKNYLYQTLYCIASLTHVTKQRFHFYMVDDGSLDIALVNEKLPGAVVVTANEISDNLDKYLPEQKYPAIRKKRLVYPHLRKLTDIHTLALPKWKLVLDSDMLFWKEPTELLHWLNNPQDNLFMVDAVQSYGYSENLMRSLCGYPIPPLLNVGVAGINSDTINWDDIERWILELEATEGTTYYLEQALTAMFAAGKQNETLPAGQYIVYPTPAQSLNSTGVLHHYVDLSKKEYYLHCWKKFIS